MKNTKNLKPNIMPTSSANWTDALRGVVRAGLAPPPRLSLSEWADRYAYLSPETSSSPGKFRAFEYQNGIMNAVTDPAVTTITVMKSARVGYTKILDNILGFFIHQDPSPVLMVFPRVEDGEDYSRTEIVPMLRDTPVLAEITGQITAKDPQQRIAKRVFRNGASVSFVGANSPAGFRRVAARIVGLDEVDGYAVAGAGDEGDQVSLAVKRSETFWNRKIILGSTPTVKGVSRIEKSFNESDQRRYHVPCPHCGDRQVLKWANMKWDKDQNGAHMPQTAHFVCVNGCIIEESSKAWMIENGEWIAEKPFNGHAGFHIWSAYSLFPNACWANIVAEFLRVKSDPIQLQTFANTVWGESWEATSDSVDGNSLITRGEAYGNESLPDDIRFLVSGTDTQADRFETTILGFGAADEVWVVEHAIHYGDPATRDLWAEYDHFLLRPYRTVSGRELRIRAACVDAGGKWAQQVTDFCQSRASRHVYAIAGLATAAAATPLWPNRPSKTASGQRIWMLNVHRGKELTYSRLRLAKPGPGYVHFPASEAFDAQYFNQLTAERILTKFRRGIPYRVWDLPSGRRNEALDCFVYATAARHSIRHLRLDEAVMAPRASDPMPSMFPTPPKPAVSIARQLAGVNSGDVMDGSVNPDTRPVNPAGRLISFRRD
jgi:phage terminase large subunit GpA-like protein